MTLDEVQRRVNSRQFARWYAAYEIEPWGEVRQDRRAAGAIWLHANGLGAKVDMDWAMNIVNPWARALEIKLLPTHDELRKKIDLFNAGLKAHCKG